MTHLRMEYAYSVEKAVKRARAVLEEHDRGES
jgi:hypothetical protein